MQNAVKNASNVAPVTANCIKKASTDPLLISEVESEELMAVGLVLCNGCLK